MCRCMKNSEISVTIPFWIDTSVMVKCKNDNKSSAGHLGGEKKTSLQTEIEGLRKHKAYLDKKYAEIDMKLGSKNKKYCEIKEKTPKE